MTFQPPVLNFQPPWLHQRYQASGKDYSKVLGADFETQDEVFVNFLVSGYSGLQVLHSHECAHMDVTAFNVLITKAGLKICTCSEWNYRSARLAEN
jgi:hypothetical protein